MYYWILSTYTSGQFGSVQGAVNFTTNAVFAAIPANQSTAVTAVVTAPGLAPTQCGPVVPYGVAIAGEPVLVGPGSTRMLLVLQGVQTQRFFSELFRVAVWSDVATMLQNATGGAGGARPAWWTVLAVGAAAALAAIDCDIPRAARE
jgi:hypothetical protein